MATLLTSTAPIPTSTPMIRRLIQPRSSITTTSNQVTDFRDQLSTFRLLTFLICLPLYLCMLLPVYLLLYGIVLWAWRLQYDDDAGYIKGGRGRLRRNQEVEDEDEDEEGARVREDITGATTEPSSEDFDVLAQKLGGSLNGFGLAWDIVLVDWQDTPDTNICILSVTIHGPLTGERLTITMVDPR